MLCYKETIPVLTKIYNLFETLVVQFPNLNFVRVIIGENEFVLFESEIIIADDISIAPHLEKLKQIKWIQTTWAGISSVTTALCRVETFPALISRSSGERTAILMTEYIITSITIFERKMYQIRENQIHKEWLNGDTIMSYRNLMNLKIGILGCGVIGSKVAQLLKHFGCEIWIMGRQNRVLNEKMQRIVSRYCQVRDLPVLFENCDYIINILPSTNETRGLLNGGILQCCATKPTVFINVGRGDIVDENELIEAIDKKWISAAILDVFQQEPLPKTSRLWNIPNISITSHIASGASLIGIVEVFGENLKRFLENKPLIYNVDWKNGY